MNGSILQVHALSKRFGGVQAVWDLSLSLAPGTVTGLIGPNGSGKSTVFNLITAFDRADAGTILYRGQPIQAWAAHRVARSGLGRTFQLVRVFPRMTALENLLVASLDRREAHSRAAGLLEQFNLASHRDEDAASLSYGQQKLLEFARLLMNPHDLILLDEPFAGVNPTTATILLEHIQKLHEAGVTVFIIDHAMRIMLDVCQTILVLDHGELIASGTPSQIRNDEGVLNAYFGR